MSAVQVALRLCLILVILGVGALACSPDTLGSAFAAGSPQVPPPPPPLPPGKPTGLFATPHTAADQILLRWTPGANATVHFLYLVKADGTGGRYWDALAGSADTVTVAALATGTQYLFAVVAGRNDGAGAYEWSDWSDWARGTPGLPAPPPLPTNVPGGSVSPTTEAGSGESNGHDGADIEGTVLSIDTTANTFTVQVSEYEHFGQNTPTSPITVDYGQLEHVETWVIVGSYVEVEGNYEPSTNTLRAYEIESEDDDDDGGDDDDDNNDRHEGAEIEGTVLSIDTTANTFTVRISEYEHFGQNVPTSPITVGYGQMAHIETWVIVGRRVEVEGNYDTSTNTLSAYEIESEDDD